MIDDEMRNAIAGREHLKTMAQTLKSGVKLDQQAITYAAEIMSQNPFDADNRNGVGELSFGVVAEAAVVNSAYADLQNTEQMKIADGTERILIDFNGNTAVQKLPLTAPSSVNAK